MTNDWFIVGVSGVTCGGKTTLCNRLSDQLPFQIVTFQQDDFFHPDDSDQHVIIPELQHANWDILSSIDMDALFKRIMETKTLKPKTNPGVIIIDGHLILNYGLIRQLCHKMYYLVLTKEQCWERRRVREYNPPDPPGYFEQCVWPTYEMYKKELNDTGDGIMYLDGAGDLEVTFQQVYNNLLPAITEFATR